MCILKWGKFIQCPVLLFFPTPPSPTAYWACSSPPPLLSPCTIWNRKESDTPCFHHRDYETSSTWCVESLQFGQQTTFAQQASTLRFVPLLQEMTFFLLNVVDVDHHWFFSVFAPFFLLLQQIIHESNQFLVQFHHSSYCECMRMQYIRQSLLSQYAACTKFGGTVTVLATSKTIMTH